jgi:hypothetical protein
MDDFRKLGNHLKNATSAYGDSEKRLSILDERVEKLIDTGEISASKRIAGSK